MGLSAAVLALTGVLGAVSTDVAAGARAEVMAGSAPVLPTEPPRAAFAMELVPLAAFEARDRRFRFVIRYDPRLFLRRPNVLGLDRPVFLHRATADETVVLGPTAMFRSGQRGSVGEVDYVGLSGVLSPTQLSQLNLSIIRLYEVEQDLALDLQTDSRTRLTLGAFAAKGGPLDSGVSAIPVHTRAGAGPSIRHRTSPRDELRVPVLVEYHRVNQADIAAESAELDWEHLAGRRTTTLLGAGALVAEYPEPSRGSSLIPTVTAAVTEALVHRRDARLDGRLGVTTRAVLNLLRAEYRPLATAEASLTMRVPPHWSVSARASFSTAATRTPLPTGEPETFFSAETPIVYTVNESWALEAGTRTLFLAPHLSEGLKIEQTQFWGYAAVTALFGSAPDPRETVR